MTLRRRALISGAAAAVPGIALGAPCGEQERRKLIKFSLIDEAFACGNTPGAPLGLSQTGVTSTSVTITWSPPTSGGALDHGQYQVQYKLDAAGVYTNGPVVPYCTLTGSITDSFGNVWKIGATGPNGLFVNNVYITPTNNVTLVYLVAGVIWQFGSGSWYSFTPTQNYGATPPAGTAFAGPFSTNPLIETISGLTTSQLYDFKVSASNTGGVGPFSVVLTATPGPVPGVPTGLASTGTTSTSVTVTWSPPITGGTLDHGTYTLQDALHNGAFSTIATVQYCTSNSGAIIDSFGNSWAISASAAPGGGITINGAYDTPTNNVTLLYLVAGVIWQFGSGSWYSFQPTQNYGATPPTAPYAGPFSANPLVITAAGLTTNQAYDFRVEVSNAAGTGPFSSLITATPVAVVNGSFQIWGIYDFGNYATGRAATSNTITAWGPYVGGSSNQTFGAGFQGDVNLWLGDFNTSIFNPLPNYLMWAMMLLDRSSTFAQVAAGNFDADFQYLVAQTATRTGLKRFGIRPGWEMNGVAGWPWDAVSNPSGYVSAFQHAVNVIRAQAVASGVRVDIAWCPGAAVGHPDPRVAMYPGDAYVDFLSMDFGAGGTINDITDSSTWTFQGMCNGCVNGFRDGNNVLQGKGKPISVSEGEIPQNNPSFNPADQYPTYMTAMTNILNNTRPTMAFYEVYDSNFGANANNSPWGNNTAVAALNGFITTAANFKAT